MELPGLTKALYGMTRLEAIRAGVCIDCKKDAQWYSPAGKAEYFISGLCEPCFDKITGEPEEETMNTGSAVDGVLNNDHAQAAELWLNEHGFADDWQVVVADDRMLMLDYDDQPEGAAPFLPEQFFRALGILEQIPGQERQTYYQASVSKGGNTHVIVHLSSAMDVLERIAWQAAFGSDPKREALHLLSVSRDELNPILLFMRKARHGSGVDANGNSIVQCSHVDIATPEKLLAAGVPQLLLGDGNAK